MTAPLPAPTRPLASFRAKLTITMMLVVSAVTATAVLYAHQSVAANAKRELAGQFQRELAAFRAVRDMRHAALAERCRTLARKPRIHAALEDDALDLLYLSARDELREVRPDDQGDSAAEPGIFRARFYRFLDARGAVIPTTDTVSVGALGPAEESSLALPVLRAEPQSGYVWRVSPGADPTVDELIAIPVISMETGQPIAALVLGFPPVELPMPSATLRSGIWLAGRLHLPALAEADRQTVARELAQRLGAPAATETNFPATLTGGASLVFYQTLNPGSAYPAAYEIGVYPLTDLVRRQHQLTWQFASAGALLLLGGWAASHLLSRRLARPVERLAVDSEINRAQRARAEAALEISHEELQRSARFSADASHQLKTPVTVLRAGLEELLAGESLTPGDRAEVSSLVHQTFRLTSVIEDLLLLSRMDAGRLQLVLAPVNLVQLVDGWLDDFEALPDPLQLQVVKDLPAEAWIAGEARYTTLILQNLLENARKYNRPGGLIRLRARTEAAAFVLAIGNTGPAIPVTAQATIFQRFHRGAMGENLPGHGLGLNLARELCRLHHGTLQLLGSAGDWTEFEVRFALAEAPVRAALLP